MLYYMSRAIADQGMKDGDWNYKLMPVCVVYFMNFSITNNEHIINDISLYSKAQLKEGVTTNMHAYLFVPKGQIKPTLSFTTT